MEKILILTRGLPCAGKSAFAKLLGRAICCADDYITRNGIYLWKPETVSASHEWCQRKCRRFMKIGIERIIIANTNTTMREMKPYFDMAKQFGYKTYSVIVEKYHNSTNNHNVPEETIEKMANRFEIKLK